MEQGCQVREKSRNFFFGQGILSFGAYTRVCVSAFTEGITHTFDNNSF